MPEPNAAPTPTAAGSWPTNTPASLVSNDGRAGVLPLGVSSGHSRAHVCLIGLRGAGKSTVGALLATRLHRHFHDLDELVLRRLDAKSVKAVFEREGEAHWRNGERAAIEAFFAAPLTPSVLALGGGALTVDAVARRVGEARQSGTAFVVLLSCEPETAAQRLARDPGDRASITGAGLVEELGRLHADRIARYRSSADVEVDTNGCSPEDVVERVLSVYAARSCSSQPSPR
jgi:shikimate kinase